MTETKRKIRHSEKAQANSRAWNAKTRKDPEFRDAEAERKRAWYEKNKEREQAKRRARKRFHDLEAQQFLVVAPFTGRKPRGVPDNEDPLTILNRITQSEESRFNLHGRTWKGQFVRFTAMTRPQVDQVFYHDKDGMLCTRNVLEQVAYLMEFEAQDLRKEKLYTTLAKKYVIVRREAVLDAGMLRTMLKQVGGSK